MGIINSTLDLEKYIEVSSSDNFNYYAPSVAMAERRYLKPVLGAAQYQALVDAMAAGPISPDMTALLALAQEAVANLAMSIAVSRLSATIGSNGTRRTESTSEKTAYQYQETNMRDAFVMAGFGAIDDMLALLEDKPLVFAAWAGSSAYADYKKYFIKSGLQFNDLFEIRQSRYTYMSIRPIMRRVEDFDVRAITGDKLFTFLKAGLLTSDLNEKYTGLLDKYIRPAVALLTMAKGVVEKAVDISDYGVSTNLNLATSNSQQKQPATKDQTEKIAEQLKTDGNKYLSMLAEELAKNPTDYPDYEAPESAATNFNINNKQENAIVAV